jgi:hypothetical protein
MKRVPIVLATCAAALLLAGCASKMSQEEAENQISAVLEEEIGEAPEEVSCPGDIDAEVDKTMTCDVTVAGETAKVKMTITSVEGDTAKFDVEVVE